MDVDPVVPPVNRFRIVAEGGPLFRRQRGREQLHVERLEHVLIVQDEGLIKLDEFSHAVEIALLAGQRRFLEVQGDREAVDAGDYGLLHGDGKALVASLRNGNRLEFCAQPVLEPLLGAVVLAVGEPGELNGAAHIHGVYPRGRQLIEARVAAIDDGGGDERDPAANQVHGNDVETLARIGGQLAEVGAEKIGERSRSVDALIPSAERLVGGGLHNRRAHDGNRQIRAAAREQRFGEALGKRVGVRPAQMPGAAPACQRQAVANPAGAIAAQDVFEVGGARTLKTPAAAERLAAQGGGQLGAFRAGFDAANHFL